MFRIYLMHFSLASRLSKLVLLSSYNKKIQYFIASELSGHSTVNINCDSTQ